jgi:hypothetical protein
MTTPPHTSLKKLTEQATRLAAGSKRKEEEIAGRIQDMLNLLDEPLVHYVVC